MTKWYEIDSVVVEQRLADRRQVPAQDMDTLRFVAPPPQPTTPQAPQR